MGHGTPSLRPPAMPPSPSSTPAAASSPTPAAASLPSLPPPLPCRSPPPPSTLRFIPHPSTRVSPFPLPPPGPRSPPDPRPPPPPHRTYDIVTTRHRFFSQTAMPSQLHSPQPLHCRGGCILILRSLPLPLMQFKDTSPP